MMDASERVTVRSWRERDGRRVEGRVQHLQAAQLPDVLERLWKSRRHATAHCPGNFVDEVGGVVPHPDTGRLVWWSEIPDDLEDEKGIA